jgi:transcriptional regulator with XRE-family HTH domain
VISRTFPSKLVEFLGSPEAELEIDNDVAYQVAMNALHLRRYRGKSQSEVAKAMGSSQPAVARIEGGDENITLQTLKRLINALEGRLRLSIEPKEAGLPHWGNWWDSIVDGVLLAKWSSRGIAIGRADLAERHIAGVFSATSGTSEAGDERLLLAGEGT